MSILTDIKEYPGTIPFHGVPVGIEIDVDEKAWCNVDFSKDMVIKMTFPKGVDDYLEVAAKSVKYFDGELISAERHLIIIKADRKMIGYTLLYSFRDQYNKI